MQNDKNGLQQFQMESCLPINRLKDKKMEKQNWRDHVGDLN
jgi:hypothetical protein